MRVPRSRRKKAYSRKPATISGSTQAVITSAPVRVRTGREARRIRAASARPRVFCPRTEETHGEDQRQHDGVAERRVAERMAEVGQADEGGGLLAGQLGVGEGDVDAVGDRAGEEEQQQEGGRRPAGSPAQQTGGAPGAARCPGGRRPAGGRRAAAAARSRLRDGPAADDRLQRRVVVLGRPVRRGVTGGDRLHRLADRRGDLRVVGQRGPVVGDRDQAGEEARCRAWTCDSAGRPPRPCAPRSGRCRTSPFEGVLLASGRS